MSTAALPMKNGLQFKDAYTVVYSPSCESRQSGFVEELLTSLHLNKRTEKTLQAEVKEMTKEEEEIEWESPHTQLHSYNDDNDNNNNIDINTPIGLNVVLKLLQDCCLRNDDNYQGEEEQKFISTITAIRSLNSTRIGSSHSTIDTDFTGVPHTVDGVCLANKLHIKLEDLQLMDAFGQPQRQQQEEEGKGKGKGKEEGVHKIPFLRNVFESFCIVTDQSIPKYLYYLMESLFCELPYSWLLHTFFANTPMSLIGTEEGFHMTKEQLELQESSLRFLLSVENARDVNNPEDSQERIWRTQQLHNMLNEVTKVHEVFNSDKFLKYIAKEWHQCIETLRISLSTLDETISGFSPPILLEYFERLLLLSPQRVSYRIVHSFLLPLVELNCREDSIKQPVKDKNHQIQSLVVLLATSFDGTSLEEVEYFLQPSETDHTSDVEIFLEGTELTARLYRHFYETFVKLLRASSLYKVDIIFIPSPFFDINKSPFIRSVHPTRLASVVRSHFYALFDVFAEKKTCKVKTVVFIGGIWVQTARGFFQQWLSEKKKEELSIYMIFKQLWEVEKENEEGLNPHSFFPLLHHMITSVPTAQVAVFIPASKVTLLSRRYGLFPLIPPTHNSVKKEYGIVWKNSVKTRNHFLFTEMLQFTLIPLLSYSVCGGAPLAYIYDTFTE
ncbi:uncharacterized protein TM35_000073390 [Trypanosoma theileri]|uniref:Uncharacterized protein n=1 Tax=Trypanosoma theileri TaxID=67003 RepID=A0A1X0P1Z2_9TRYP|nr:uncharacterized protein TM35_000073390 [Trypanosoma theileri]ORC90915.1 hypothetical protein TM35_000073390 [Trypanosoma theileri]